MNLTTIQTIAIKAMIGLLTAVILFHFSILFKLIPYDIAWGGRLSNDTEMYVFEIISILINCILITVLLLKADYIKHSISYKILNGILWVFIILFVLNTVGNIFAKTYFEKSFSILTCISAVLIWIILKKNKNEHLKIEHMNADREIFSSRILNSSIEIVYKAFANPEHLKNWWGPNGFTNTIHEFDLRPGGKWILTMHGPEKDNYKNSSIFKIVEPHTLVSWKRVSQPLFDMEIAFKKLNASETEISFRMIFDSVEECEKIRKFAEPQNEENFDRLESEISKMKL